MGSKGRAEPSREINAARSQVEGWRRTRQKAGRMPEELWDLAVGLARVHGVNPIARALALDYYSLKKRLDAAVVVPRSAPTFVEVDLASTGGSTECVLEFEERKRGKMTIRLRGTNGVDIAALAAAFWKRRG